MAKKHLVIVESPAKAKTIGKYLGKDYEVKASMGHLRDLPKSKLGVDIEHDFEPVYQPIRGKEELISELKKAAKSSDTVYLATDPDREGEAISWHLKALLNLDDEKAKRVTFNEITKKVVSESIKEPRAIDQDLVDAQQARRVLDRIVGYQLSPLLWKKVRRGLSAGRVQSVAVRMVDDREKEIQAFEAQEYWTLDADLTDEATHKTFEAHYYGKDGKKVEPASGEQVDGIIADIGDKSFTVTNIKRTDKQRSPSLPFTTSTLQQEASRKLNMTPRRTMAIAQQLYEGVDITGEGTVGLITYMRTDSLRISEEAIAAAKTFILGRYGQSYYPKTARHYKAKAGAQDAHEAIRPTDVRRTPEAMAPYLDPMQLKLYSLIWRRFVASQMTPAVQNLTTVDVGVAGADARNYTFRATATVPVFPGFSKVYEEVSKRKDETREAEVLGKLREKQPLSIHDVEKEQKFTEPPPRYSEAALIKELEENGIGRPSTYATILRTIQDRKYVSREQGKLVPTELGFSVCDFLVEKLPALFDIGFTARMEQQLDEVEEGKVGWTDMMADFYAQFVPWLEAAKNSDLPPADEAAALLSLFDHVTFEAAQKVGKRTYDDGKFCRSLREKFDSDGKITARQYQALISLAAKYSAQLETGLKALPEKLRNAVEAAAILRAEREENRERSEAACASSEYPALFAAFDKVNFEPVTKRGRFSYDDRKFFDSLRKQALSGRALSEKQLGALRKLAQKYRGELTDPALVDRVLGMEAAAAPAKEEGGAAGETAAAPVASPETERLLEGLKAVTQWAEPVKRGRFTYDDKAFYESLAKQYAAGRRFSEKQQAALAKMAAKYGVK